MAKKSPLSWVIRPLPPKTSCKSSPETSAPELSSASRIGKDSGNNISDIRIAGIVRWSTYLVGSLSGNMGIEITEDPRNAATRNYGQRIKKQKR